MLLEPFDFPRVAALVPSRAEADAKWGEDAATATAAPEKSDTRNPEDKA